MDGLSTTPAGWATAQSFIATEFPCRQEVWLGASPPLSDTDDEGSDTDTDYLWVDDRTHLNPGKVLGLLL